MWGRVTQTSLLSEPTGGVKKSWLLQARVACLCIGCVCACVDGHHVVMVIDTEAVALV